jgi:hypothetical protein
MQVNAMGAATRFHCHASRAEYKESDTHAGQRSATMGLTTDIPDLRDVLTGELAQPGRWLVASVEARISWPVNPQKVVYRGQDFWVLPITKQHYPGIALNRPSAMPRDVAERLIMQFLSSLAWVESGGILVEHLTENQRVMPMGRKERSGFAIQDSFDLSYFPEPSDEKGQLALAIMREGRGVNHPAYAFLSFYRVLEVALGDGKARGRWMLEHIEQIGDPRAKEVIAKLRANGVDDIGVHLQKSGRQAIAHANSKPIINPDDPVDYRRLSAELPIIEALAVHAIDSILGVETRTTVWRKHLYELAGFKSVFSEEIVASFTKAEPVSLPADFALTPINVELRRRSPYRALAELNIIGLVQDGSVVTLVARSADQCFEFRCHLDFAEERLHFDIQYGVAGRDDGTADGAERMADLHRFVYEYLCNGQLRILNATSGELLSRNEAFLPVNCMVNDEVCNARIEKWKQTAEQRRGCS